MRLKGSYTVEATIIISFSLILFGIAIGITYDLFKLIIEYVKYKDGNFDAVSIFRLKEGLNGVMHAIKD